MYRRTLLAALAAVSIATHAADMENLEKRVEELERMQKDTFLQANEEKGIVKPFLSKHSILLGGFFETAITHIVGPDTKAQYSANANVFGLNITAEMDEQNRVVAQMLTSSGYTMANIHNDPRATLVPKKRQFTSYFRALQVNQAYFEHTFSRALNLQMGTGYAPYGYALQQREMVLFKRREGPQLVQASNFSTSVGIAFPLWTGLHLHGSFQQGDNRTGYNLYTLTPTTNAKNIGAGARLWYRWQEYMTVGVSTQVGDELANTYQSYGADADGKVGRYGLTLEYARTSVTGGHDRGLETYNAQPYVEFWNGKFLVYGVVDYMDNPVWLTQANITDAYKRWDMGGGVNWLPKPTMRFRLGYLVHNYVDNNSIINKQDRDYYRVDLSAGISF